MLDLGKAIKEDVFVGQLYVYSNEPVIHSFIVEISSLLATGGRDILFFHY
jgi:hypothetical protein